MAGQLIQRGEGRWLVRVYLGRDGKTGKRRYHNKTIHGTKKEARQYKTKVLRQLDTGTFVQPSRKALSEYLDEWLDTAAKPRVSARTLEDYRGVLRRYIRPALGHRMLSQITPLEIQKVYAEMQDRGLSARTVRSAHAVIRSALEQAVKWRLLSRNPCKYVDLPKQRRKERKVFSREEANLFLETAKNDDLHALWVVLLTTGMRPGEALGLKWKDIGDGRIRVQRSLVRTKEGGWRLKEPKTSRSRRSITLPASTQEALRIHRVRQAKERLEAGPEWEGDGLVFTTSKGTPLDLPNITRRHFKPLLEQAGLPDMRMYDLRHSCATLLLAAGEHPKVVSERLGHSSVTLTLDTYSHVLPDMQEATADRLEEMLFG